ncbi:hypothetical protein JCM10213_005271 [Rhodosporidiobolus nylandii]
MASQDPRMMQPPHPSDLIRNVQATVNRSIEGELSPQDRLIAHEAEARILSNARRGFWIGTFLGGAWAFRSRFTAGRAAVRNGSLPRLFFPSAQEGKGSLKEQIEAAKKAAQEAAKEDAQAGAKAAEESMREGRGRFFARAFGFGILGSVIGTQVGVAYGRYSSNKFLEDSGRKDAINAAMERGLERAAREISQIPGAENFKIGMGGNRDEALRRARDIGRNGGAGIEGVGYEEPGRELEHGASNEGVGYSDRAPPQDQLPGSLSDPTIPSGSYSPSSPASSSGPSRWDQLRQSRAAPPSRWDELRQERARSTVPPSASTDQPDDRSERELLAARDTAADKERRRKEFDALFEKEARGGDDSMDDKAWK